MTQPRIDGIHHITAIASDPQPNLDFYVRFLGLRLVKRTVNFDDPGTYHLYYGDETGAPGSIMTFCPWPGAARGRRGTAQVTHTSFAVPAGALEYWTERAERSGFKASREADRFNEPVLALFDGDDLALELIEGAGCPECTQPDGADIPGEYAIRLIYSATIAAANIARTSELLTGTMGFREAGREDNRTRFTVGSGGPGAFLDVVTEEGGKRGLQGAGTVHHIAFRTPDDEHQLAWSQTLMNLGYQVSPVMDRNYFHSIYYREPGGVLFEIATDGPGFAVDEPADELGRNLKLPEMYESMRERIEASLPAITVPTTGLLTESY